MPFGNQPQQLTYRVEIEKSSLSEAVSQIQLAVGTALTSAMAGVSGLSDKAHVATAAAFGSSNAHLAFMDQQRSRVINQPGGPVPGGTSFGGVLQAIGIKSGLVDPGFAQTQAGMQLAAQQTLSAVHASTMETINKVGGAASTILGIGSLGASLFGAAALSTGLAAAAVPIDAALIGINRASERDQLRGSLSRYGRGHALSVINELEDNVTSMAGVSFGEAVNVGRSALMNLGPASVSRDDVRQVLRDSLQSWRMAGKMTGFGKEESLDLISDLNRMGIRPGAGMDQYLSRTAAAADVLGVTTSGLANASLQMQQASMGLGYNALAAGNQFVIQSGMIGEAIRTGAMNRQTLTMAAGFYGPQGDQAIAAAQGWMASMRTLNEGGFGQMMALGAMRGGSGGAMDMMSAASGASLREILSLPSEARRNFDPDALNKAYGATAMSFLRSQGVEKPTEEVLANAFRSIDPNSFATEGQALMAAHRYLNPGLVGRERGIARRKRESAAAAAAERSSYLGEWYDEATMSLGAIAELEWTGVDRSGAFANPTIAGLAKDVGEENAKVFGGIRGAARGAWYTMTAQWQNVREMGHSVYTRLGGRESLSDFVSDDSMTKAEVSRLTSSDLRRMSAGADEVARAARAYNPDKRTAMTTSDLFLAADLGRRTIWDETAKRGGAIFDMSMSHLRSKIGDALDVDVSQPQVQELVMGNLTFQDKLSRASTESDKAALRAERIEALQRIDGLSISKEQAERLAGIMDRSGTTKLFSAADRARNAALSEGKAEIGAIAAVMGDESALKGLTSQMFDKDSEISAELLKGGSNLDSISVRKLFERATMNRQWSRSFSAKAKEAGLTATEMAIRTMMDAASLESGGDAPVSSGPAPAATASVEVVALTQQVATLINELRNGTGIKVTVRKE